MFVAVVVVVKWVVEGEVDVVVVDIAGVVAEIVVVVIGEESL